LNDTAPRAEFPDTFPDQKFDDIAPSATA